MRFAPIFAVAALSMVGCAVTPEELDDESADISADSVTYGAYHTVRKDMRRCISPLCGGYWLKRANRELTLCADGTWASECYVATLDLRAKTGLTDSELEGVDLTRLVVRGTIKLATMESWKLGKFTASEVWYPGSDTAPTGTFYKVTDLGIRCAKAPCFSFEAQKLEYSTKTKLSGVTGGAEGALCSTPILAAGTIAKTSFGGKELTAAAFYTRLAHKVGACDTDAECTASVYRADIQSSADCYCRSCAGTVLDTTTATARAKAWDTHCASKSLMCPAVRCMAPPPVGCVAGRCQAL